MGHGDRKDEVLREILFETYVDCQKECEASGKMPRDDDTALARFRPALELVGAIQLGILIACVTTLINFLITRMVLHIDIPWF